MPVIDTCRSFLKLICPGMHGTYSMGNGRRLEVEGFWGFCCFCFVLLLLLFLLLLFFFFFFVFVVLLLFFVVVFFFCCCFFVFFLYQVALRFPVISYPGHFVPKSFRTFFGHFIPSNNHFVPRSFRTRFVHFVFRSNGYEMT